MGGARWVLRVGLAWLILVDGYPLWGGDVDRAAGGLLRTLLVYVGYQAGVRLV